MKIYTASKIWHAPSWRHLRDSHVNVEITSRWIDYENGSFFVEQCKDQLWQHCLEDVMRADAMVIYCGDETEQQRGVVMEAGHAMAAGVPIYCINTCETFQACPESDVAFTHHPMWNWVAKGQHLAFRHGVDLALEMAAWDQKVTEFSTIGAKA